MSEEDKKLDDFLEKTMEKNHEILKDMNDYDKNGVPYWKKMENWTIKNIIKGILLFGLMSIIWLFLIHSGLMKLFIEFLSTPHGGI